jgi:hypothetical protein
MKTIETKLYLHYFLPNGDEVIETTYKKKFLGITYEKGINVKTIYHSLKTTLEFTL